MSRRRLKGVVVSDKMQKTVVVEVARIKKHSRYLRRYDVHKKYKAHDAKGEAKIGDTVLIEETRPLSKDKRWRVIEPETKKVKDSQSKSKS